MWMKIKKLFRIHPLPKPLLRKEPPPWIRTPETSLRAQSARINCHEIGCEWGCVDLRVGRDMKGLFTSCPICRARLRCDWNGRWVIMLEVNQMGIHRIKDKAVVPPENNANSRKAV